MNWPHHLVTRMVIQNKIISYSASQHIYCLAREKFGRLALYLDWSKSTLSVIGYPQIRKLMSRVYVNAKSYKRILTHLNVLTVVKFPPLKSDT